TDVSIVDLDGALGARLRDLIGERRGGGVRVIGGLLIRLKTPNRPHEKTEDKEDPEPDRPPRRELPTPSVIMSISHEGPPLSRRRIRFSDSRAETFARSADSSARSFVFSSRR